MKKHQTRCNDCGYTFFLEDANYCIHYHTTSWGTKECPQCHNCICHGETADQIKTRFSDNLKKGKFILSINTEWAFQCKSVKEMDVD
jgi:hypothetical protein